LRVAFFIIVALRYCYLGGDIGGCKSGKPLK
jgi:hypothetical protein